MKAKELIRILEKRPEWEVEVKALVFGRCDDYENKFESLEEDIIETDYSPETFTILGTWHE